MHILVINAGSSSMKFGLFDFESLQPVARGMLDWAGSAQRATITLMPSGGQRREAKCDVPDYRTGVAESLRLLSDAGLIGEGASSLRVIGHRLIHGGEEIRRPVRIDQAMKRAILRYVHLAPLHIPAGVEAIEACEAALPQVPQVGLFDTAFFGGIPRSAYLYPVPSGPS